MTNDTIFFGVQVSQMRADYLYKCLLRPLCRHCGREVAECSADPCGNQYRDERIRDLAADQRGEGIEIIHDGEVSEVEDNGAYVQVWIWVDFAGTDLDKDREEGSDM